MKRAALIYIVLCICALPVESVMPVSHVQTTVFSVLPVIQTHGIMSPLAVVAFSATHMGLAGHPVPGLEIFYALSHFYNLSGPFVSHNKGIVGGQLANLYPP